MRRFVSLFFVLLINVIILCGCNSMNSSEEKYTTQYATGAMEYSLFVNKQITVVSNQMTTTIITANKVSNGQYPSTDAINSAEKSLQIIKTSYEEVKKMHPPAEYTENREHTLQLIDTVINDIETYIDEIKKEKLNSEAISSLVEIMEVDLNNLTSEFNSYYK